MHLVGVPFERPPGREHLAALAPPCLLAPSSFAAVAPERVTL
jgi:hypothetical protein